MGSSYVKFEDNRVKMKTALNDKAIKFLNEAASSIIQQTQRNTPVSPGGGRLKRSFDLSEDSYIDEDKLTAYVGSSLEYSIWVEMGTGEYALKGNGRKGYWVYVDDGRVYKGKDDNPKKYTLEEAKRAVAYLRERGLNAYYTNGMKPKRMLYKAYETKKAKIQQQANEIFKEMNSV